MQDDYSDIMNFLHHQSEIHPHMSIHDRAAQFSPFAALTGYEEAVRETARLTEGERDIAEDRMEQMDTILGTIREHIGEKPYVTITCFKPDPRKDGGEYIRLSGQLKKIDDTNRRLVFVDGTSVSADLVTDILWENDVPEKT